MKPALKPTAILFDVDGTLAETEEAHRAAFNLAFVDFGLDWTWDQDLYRLLLKVTGGKERLEYFMDRYGISPRLSPDEVKALHGQKTLHYDRLLSAGELALRPGVARLIQAARSSDVKLAIATTTSEANVASLGESTLGKSWAEFFQVIAAGDVVNKKKPAPDIYELAIEQLGVDPKEAIAIEDSRNGLVSARTAGLKVVITPSFYTSDEDFSQAQAVVDHLGDPGNLATVQTGPNLDAGEVDLAWLAKLLAR